ncbi:hypothetical protein [Rhizobium rhizoryzae]|uniref:VWA domain-containing protein n=1 Tax=Rhizobium rhizoryzae TaxID=451876 RepID=A0A7W6LM78_9HYPH|nr:hypothetical protein [Rhizobium rhizoryzae]MBB4145988.1 hypothetical protein [Rhizobium rhizoryzae]
MTALGRANHTEKNAHDAKKNKNFERFIVFMTDGEMTGSTGVWNKPIDDKVRGICDQAKADGIKVYASLSWHLPKERLFWKPVQVGLQTTTTTNPRQ